MVSSPRFSEKLSSNIFWYISGVYLVCLTASLVFLSGKFKPEIPLEDQPILWLVALLILSSAGYLFTIKKISTLKKSNGILAWIFAVGFILRIVMIGSTPMLEVDYNRYLWDGAVTANGLNPYLYSPEEIQNTDSISQSIPEDYVRLANESNGIPGKINHAYLKTVYPPVTQFVFAAAHFLNPWDLDTWRFLLLVFDGVTLLLLFKILRHLKLSLFWLLIYWWNPLLINEIFNSGHMDVLLFPFILGAILMYLRNKNIWSVVLLALAVGVKLWPVLLLPFFLKKQFRHPAKLLVSIAVFGFIVLAILAPVYLTGFDENSGLTNYSERWQLNDGIFKLLVWGSQFFLGLFGVHPGFKYITARYVVFFLMIIWLGYLMLRKQEKSKDFVNHCLWAVTGLFFLSPTQFPWYSLWLLPFLTIRPRFSLLLLTATMPLYYLRYYFEARSMTSLFDFGIVWLEYLPVWILLVREVYCSNKNIPHISSQFTVANEI